MAEVINLGGEQAKSRAHAKEILAGRFVDVRDEPATGGWSAMCPLCDSETRIRISRDYVVSSCPNSHDPGQIMEATAPPPEPFNPSKIATSILGTAPIPLSVESIRRPPPARQYMLRDSSTGHGVYVQSRVGLLAATGGSGKTWSAVQLAVAQATGVTWFGSGGWTPVDPGRVLALFAEETEDECERMLHFAIRAAHLNEQQIELLASNLDMFALAGTSVDLTTIGRTEGLPESQFAVRLRDFIHAANEAGAPYKLIILDPLSRFEGPEVESDTTAATRFIQVVETFTTYACGFPSAIVNCHTRKGRKDDEPDSADAIRGPSALKDAVRWAARLEQQKHAEGTADLLTLRIVKANGIPPQRVPLILCRDSEFEGVLRVATPGEVESHDDLASMVKSKAQELTDYCDRIVGTMQAGHQYSRDSLVDLCGRRSLVLAAVRKLLADQRVIERRRGCLELFTGSEVPKVPEPGNLSLEPGELAVPTDPTAPFRGQRVGTAAGSRAPEPRLTEMGSQTREPVPNPGTQST